MNNKEFEILKPREKVLYVLKSLGGEQSVKSLNAHLKMKRKNLHSIVSRLSQEGKIERVKLGVYLYVEK